MNILELDGERYTLKDNLRWKGPDKGLVQLMNFDARQKEKNYGPDQGDLAGWIFRSTVLRFEATIIEENEVDDDPNTIY
jgi:hypothetical protein